MPLRNSPRGWVVGLQCTLLGALMLIAPDRFSGPLYDGIATRLLVWGSVFLLAGASLFAVTALQMGRAVRAAVHIASAVALLALAASFALEGAWLGAVSCVVVGVAVLVAPFVITSVGPGESRRGLVLPTAGLLSVMLGVGLLFPSANASRVAD